MKTQRALFFSAIVLSLFALHADVTLAQKERRPLPPEIRAQLTEDQINQLEAATNFQDKKALLDSWGIRPPERQPHHKPSAEERAKFLADHERPPEPEGVQ